tara:strand:+ start:461 stop:817 length:357 start_codon:yes stop_codon:yes gene_type:complete
MSKKLTWKRTNDAGQTESHCGRFWFVYTDLSVFEMSEHNLCCDDAADGSSLFIRLWHADTGVIVGHYATKSEAKAAAEKHLAGFAEEVRQLRHRVVDLEDAVEEHEEDWESLTATDAN